MNLIIGGSGFVGTYLINILNKNQVVNLDKTKVFFTTNYLHG